MKSIARTLFYSLSPRLRYLLRYAFFLPYDIYSSLFNRNELRSPPRRMIYTGAGDFIKIGNLFLEDFKEKKIIHPDAAILDVGCGIGRMALPLTTYLKGGSYEGFDIMKPGIQWCRKNISTKFPNFNFTLIDVANDLYKADGASAKDFSFPYPDNSFDLAVVLSVFSHMVPDEVDRYLGEIERVLKPGGYCYATFFILNDASSAAMKQNNNEFDFKYNKGQYSLLSDQVKSANVAYQESYLKEDLVEKNKFKITYIEYGSWSTGEKKSPIRFQDTIVVVKNSLTKNI